MKISTYYDLGDSIHLSLNLYKSLACKGNHPIRWFGHGPRFENPVRAKDTKYKCKKNKIYKDLTRGLISYIFLHDAWSFYKKD